MENPKINLQDDPLVNVVRWGISELNPRTRWISMEFFLARHIRFMRTQPRVNPYGFDPNHP